MRILYATSITLPSYRANRIQVVSMARAWTKSLGNDFILGIGMVSDESPKDVNFVTMGENIKSYTLAWRYMRYVKENAYTHIYCREEKLLLFMMVYNALFFRVPLTFCYELHHLVYMDVWWHKFLLKHIDRVVSITGAMKDILIEHKYPDGRILVEPDAVDMTMFNNDIKRHDARIKLGLPLDKKIIVYAGAINEPWKGVGTLYESSKHFDSSYLFLVLGGKPHYVENFYLQYPNRPNFVLAGYRPHHEIATYLKSADVAVLPNSGKSEISRISTSPMKLFEYMASGTPIVASDIPSIREILNEKNAILVNPDDSKSLAFGITQTLEHLDRSAMLAKQARIDAEKRTWDKRVLNIMRFMQHA